MIGLKSEKVRAGRGLGTVGVQEPHLEGNRMAHWVVPESETNMKKLMFAASAAICATVGFAVDGVQSNNIVGYNTTDAEDGKFTIIAAQFEDVQSGEIDLQKVLSGFIPVAYDKGHDFLKTAPQLQIQDGNGGYICYYYLLDAWDKDAKDEVQAWADSMGNLVKELKVTAGTAFWVKTLEGGDKSVVSGAVCGEDSATVEVPQDTFKLVANAFPMALDLNGEKFDGEDLIAVPWDKARDYLKTAVQIQVQNKDGGYVYYYYLSDGEYVDEKGATATKKGWCNSLGSIADEAIIGVGRGFWIKSVSGSCKLTFTK